MASMIKVLSAGAVKPALIQLIEEFRRQRGIAVQIEFATAPAIAQRLASNDPFAIVIAPPAILESRQTTPLGRIGVGVMVRQGIALPKIATVEEFKQTLSNSESIVYNQASTGLYMDNLLKQLGIAGATGAKITRCADFAAVRERIASGHANAIGFGATTVIAESAGQGVSFAGALPAELQNYTSYGAALTAHANDDAKAFMNYLASPAATAILQSAGID